MAAMKPRTGDGPLEAEKEGRGIVMRIPSEGGGRLVIELSADEAQELAQALANALCGTQGFLKSQTPDIESLANNHSIQITFTPQGVDILDMTDSS